MTRIARQCSVAVICIAALTLATQARAQEVSPSDSIQASDRAVQRALFHLEDVWAQAVVRRDARALVRLVAPRWVYTDESGVMNREAGIKAFTTGTDTVLAASNTGMRAMIYPRAAVVIGILNMSGRSPTGPFSRRYRYTDTWALIDGRWQCIASQDYLMPPVAPAK